MCGQIEVSTQYIPSFMAPGGRTGPLQSDGALSVNRLTAVPPLQDSDCGDGRVLGSQKVIVNEIRVI